MPSKVLLFGDSHVKRMLRESEFIEFFGVPGMNASSWRRHVEILKLYKVVILQVGGNDVSQHPRKKSAPVETIRDTKKELKALLDWCKKNSIVGYIMTVINRESSKAAIDLLNGRIKKTFRKYAVYDLPATKLASDKVHLTADSYERLVDSLEKVAEKVAL